MRHDDAVAARVRVPRLGYVRPREHRLARHDPERGLGLDRRGEERIDRRVLSTPVVDPATVW